MVDFCESIQEEILEKIVNLKVEIAQEKEQID